MMDASSTVQSKSMQFAVRIVKLYQYLCHEKNEYILSKQLLRCGTSIGANIAEGECAISKKDFLSKIHIAFKECNESLYWLQLLYETNYLSEAAYVSVRADCEELRRILSSITKTTTEKIRKGIY